MSTPPAGAQSPPPPFPSVPKDTYEEELGQQPDMFWCWNWPTYFAIPTFPVTLSIRAYNDPYVVAGRVTGCSFAFPDTFIARDGSALRGTGMSLGKIIALVRTRGHDTEAATD